MILSKNNAAFYLFTIMNRFKIFHDLTFIIFLNLIIGYLHDIIKQGYRKKLECYVTSNFLLFKIKNIASRGVGKVVGIGEITGLKYAICSVILNV